VSRDAFERARALVAAGVDALVVDTAHGHSQGVLEIVATSAADVPNVELRRRETVRHRRRRPTR